MAAAVAPPNVVVLVAVTVCPTNPSSVDVGTPGGMKWVRLYANDPVADSPSNPVTAVAVAPQLTVENGLTAQPALVAVLGPEVGAGCVALKADHEASTAVGRGAMGTECETQGPIQMSSSSSPRP